MVNSVLSSQCHSDTKQAASEKELLQKILGQVSSGSVDDPEVRKLLNKLARTWMRKRKERSTTGKLKGETSSESEVLENWLSEESFYDEMIAPDGSVRPVYQEVVKIMNEIEDKQPERIVKFRKFSSRAFMKDNRLYHIPRMLSKDEHSLLLKGVEQRARALQAFIRDHYNGEFRPRYIQNKVISPTPTLKFWPKISQGYPRLSRESWQNLLHSGAARAECARCSLSC